MLIYASAVILWLTASSGAVDLLQGKRSTTNTTAAPIPKPEPIDVYKVPLPPATSNVSENECTPSLNPHRTGCISIATSGDNMGSGTFLPDGRHITAYVTFVGAPAAPDPASIYTGTHLVLLKIDGTTFTNGDSWKCVTCGVSAANRFGSTILAPYPQAFKDGSRVLVGNNVVDCGAYQLASDDCTAEHIHIYPVRWSNVANDSGAGAGGTIRELRLGPDQVHITFNAFTYTGSQIGEADFIARLRFNGTGTNGTDPRYELTNVQLLSNPNNPGVVSVQGDQLRINNSGIELGELRGWTGTGQEITYVGYPVESCNIDLFAIDLATGAVRRITEHPEYADPIAVSPDDKWQVVLDTRGARRLMWVAGLRTVPPLIDMVVTAAVSSIRNNGIRRFFRPWLLDRDGDRGLYFGQQINAGGDGSPGSINDPNWNAGADPRWSPDGTLIAYYEVLAVAPACGGNNPLPCESSTEPYGQGVRIMIANLTSREPIEVTTVPEVSDSISWAVPYTPGMTIPTPQFPGAGNYLLQGDHSGSANVTIAYDTSTSSIRTVNVTYHDFCNDGINTITGFESVSATPQNLTTSRYEWYSNLTSTGEMTGTKLTPPGGFRFTIDVNNSIFEAEGNLTTTIDGVSYYQPLNGT